MSNLARAPYVEYNRALDGFTKIRKEMNNLIDSGKIADAKRLFDAIKVYAVNEDCIAMDLLAYYYKSGLSGVVKENYTKYIKWEFLAAARGNELAIEKLQFLIGYACDAIMDLDFYDLIEYKNDIDEYNVLYVLGKNICKVVVRDFLKAFPVDLVGEEDNEKKYTKEDFINIRKMIDGALPKTIEILKS